MPDRANVNSPDFVTHVSNALEHFWEVHKLGHHPLATLRCLARFLPADHATPSTLDRGRAVQELLKWALQEVKLLDSENHSVEARYYSALHKEYVEQLNNYQVVQQSNFSESTFYRTRREALKCIAEIIADLERTF